MSQGPAPESPSPLARRKPLIGFIVGVLLFAAAVWTLWRHGSDLQGALDSARRASWVLVALAVALPLVNWLLMSLSFWVLMRRHGPVRLGEMSCLIGAAWLLNYLPMRPGLIGRVAYHKAVHGIPVAKTVAVTITSIFCAGIAIAILMGAALAALERPGATVVAIGASPAVVLLALAGAMRGQFRWVPATIAIRYADLIVWSARYMVVFNIIGQPISPVAAGAISCVCQVAMLVPFFGNGLGLREWTVGATAGALPQGLLSSSGSLATTFGLAADIVNRAAEILTAIPVGLLCAAKLARRG